MVNCLYLTRNGLLEPLGQSQVFGYLRGLANDHQITLVTFEKPEDLSDARRVKIVREECERFGINWKPQRFRKRPKYLASALGMFQMAKIAVWKVRKEDIDLIHARSYIPAAVAFLVHRLTGVPFIFDMRALWPEELITAGRLKRGSYLHKLLTKLEQVCLRDAATVVVLTKAAKRYLTEKYPKELKEQHMVVIPTCADLDRFKPSTRDVRKTEVHGCIGTILSGWFRTDWLSAWIEGVARDNSESRFDIVTRDDARLVRSAIDPSNKFGKRLNVGPCASDKMPEALNGHDLSVMFYAGGAVSELGRSPTRMAEVLGVGLPVVANEGVGDVAEIVKEFEVGVILEGTEPQQVQTAIEKTKELMCDPDLPARCRSVAENLFSLGSGTRKYNEVYSFINEK